MTKSISQKIEKLSIRENSIHILMSFEDVIKLSLDSPIKNSKINKK